MTSNGEVVVELRGGMGNQLFEWATFSTLSRQTGARLWWDERLVERPSRPGNRLRSLGLVDAASIVRQTEMERFCWSTLASYSPRLYEKLSTLLQPGRPRRDFVAIGEDQLGTISRSGRYWARGYFQLPSVFMSDRGVLAPRLRQGLEAARSERTDRLPKVFAAVHVRRGDYLSQRVLGRLGLCSLDYFRNAVTDLSPDLPLVVVSDDELWCRRCLIPSLDRPSAFFRGSSDIEDLCALAHASQLVLSNSTFSWWGAFASLATTVVGPSKWFDATDAGGRDLPVIASILRDKSSGQLMERSV